MLAQEFFGGPPIVVMLGGEMDHFVTGASDPYRTRLVTGEMWIIDDQTHTDSLTCRSHGSLDVEAVYPIWHGMTRNPACEKLGLGTAC
jgi:hypothetical protein